MKIIVDSEEEAVIIARRLTSICIDIDNSNIDDCGSVSHRMFLSHLRDLIEVAKTASGVKKECADESQAQ